MMPEKPDAFVYVYSPDMPDSSIRYVWTIQLRWGSTGRCPVNITSNRRYKTEAAAQENAELWAHRLGIELFRNR